MGELLSVQSKGLRKYVRNEHDVKLLDAIDEHGTARKVEKNTDYSKRTLLRHLKVLREYAIEHGYNSEQPSASIKTDMPIRKKSTYIKYDPPRDDGAIGEWVISKYDEKSLTEILEAVSSGILIKPAKPRKFTKMCSSDILPIIEIADPHIGMLASKGETGREWNMHMARESLIYGIDDLVYRMPVVEKAVFTSLGDFTHTDGLRAETPRSHNMLEVSHRYPDIVECATSIMRHGIEAMLTKAKNVFVPIVRGNHDDITAWHMARELRAYYRNEPRVTIVDNEEMHMMMEWEKNMVVFTHGDAAPVVRMHQFITDVYDEAWGRTKFCLVAQGHVHHEIEKAIGKMLFKTFSAMSAKDAYHVFKMFSAQRSMDMVILHKDGGICDSSKHIPRRVTKEHLRLAA